jgi:hypothetical protein
MNTVADSRNKTHKTAAHIGYENILRISPDLKSLDEGSFIILKTKSKESFEATIGCKKTESGKFPGIYEIVSHYDNKKIFTTVEISHKEKTAAALMHEVYEIDGPKTTTFEDNEAPQRFNDIVRTLAMKGYQQENKCIKSRGV